MSTLLEDVEICCPYCGETFVTSIDCSAGDQDYIEDCYVCCRPISFRIECDPEGELVNVHTQREND